MKLKNLVPIVLLLAGVSFAQSGSTRHANIATFAAWTSTALNAAPVAGLGTWTVPAGHSITIIEVDTLVQTAGAGCTTAAVLDVFDGTSSILPTTLTNAVNQFTTTGSKTEPAGTTLKVRVPTNAAGCTTNPVFTHVNVTYLIN